MKILILQLARLGDIYLSWPALRALRRNHPQAEIHVLTRPRFAAALSGNNSVDKILHLPSKEILAPLVQSNMDIPAAYGCMSEFADQMYAEKYDWIVNFSFSPFSSYLTHYATHAHTKVTGYTRFTDGFLSIPDDMSAYFYAQAGVGRPNRYHLAEIFASQLGLDLVPEDWSGPSPLPETAQELPEDYIVVHIGASEARKSISAVKWISILKSLAAINPIHAVLVGSKAERHSADQIMKEFGPGSVVDLVGKTELQELFPIIQKAKLLLGCDSMPIHVAALTATPCINLSFPSVNFWETGPRSLNSIVIRALNEADLSEEKVAVAVRRVLSGERPELGHIHVIPGAPSYWALMPRHNEFDWQMIKAIYTADNFPPNQTPEFKQAVEHLSEVNQLMLTQMQNVEKSGDVTNSAPIIESGEDVIETVGKLVPSVQVLVRWYQTEKTRIPPGDLKVVLARTIEIHHLFQKVLDLYQETHKKSEKELA
jgi:heptosyltransferase III